jgi:ATP-dependent exoDNAse (exonuclease V) alpha subunit
MTQSDALNILKLGHNTFLTGGAGTGKTYVLNEFIRYLKLHDIAHAVTASTGIASTHIGGSTIHSWSGIGIRDSLSKYELEALTEKENLYKRLNNTKVLIIDEISMLHASRLDMVDAVLKKIRRSDEPFGGIQVVLCGDFYQLPPVVRDRSIDPASEYAFNATSWREAKFVVCYLTQNYRQDDDTLTSILNAIRHADEDIYESLEALNETQHNEIEEGVKLYTHNEDVDRINIENYKKIESEVEYEFEMKTSGKASILKTLKENLIAHELLKLKIGTRVMFIKNDLGRKYSNGTLGIVRGFANDGSPIVELRNGQKIEVKDDVWQFAEDGKVLAEIRQIPLRYAWAITVHKSQGMTLDSAEMDLTRGFGFGMGYVALSRVKSLAGLKLKGLNPQALKMHDAVIAFDSKILKKSEQAEDAILKYKPEELKSLHEKNILKMGGSIEEVKIEDDASENYAKAEFSYPRINTFEATLSLLSQNKDLSTVANERGLTLGTIISHLEEFKKRKIDFDLSPHLAEINKKYKKKEIKIIRDTIKAHNNKLSETVSALNKEKIKINYEDLRLIRLI